MKWILLFMLFSVNVFAKEYIIKNEDLKTTAVLSGFIKRVYPKARISVVDLEEDKYRALKQVGVRIHENVSVSVLGVQDEEVPLEGNPWGIDKVLAPDSHKLRMGKGQGITVCVVDTGVDYTHPALLGQIAGGVGVAKTTKKDVEDYFDDQGHGTHVSGTIVGNKGVLLGVAPKARVFAVKVLDSSGSGSEADVAEGILSCIGKSEIISVSLGASVPMQEVEDAINQAVDEGIIVIAASGNESTKTGYPAAYKNVISVSATDINDKFAKFSNYGKVEYAAPGVKIKSCIPDNKYAEWSGTSMATPHVSGVAAIMLSRRNKSKGLMATDIGLPPNKQGAGLISAIATASKKDGEEEVGDDD